MRSACSACRRRGRLAAPTCRRAGTGWRLAATARRRTCRCCRRPRRGAAPPRRRRRRAFEGRPAGGGAICHEPLNIKGAHNHPSRKGEHTHDRARGTPTQFINSRPPRWVQTTAMLGNHAFGTPCVANGRRKAVNASSDSPDSTGRYSLEDTPTLLRRPIGSPLSPSSPSSALTLKGTIKRVGGWPAVAGAAALMLVTVGFVATTGRPTAAAQPVVLVPTACAAAAAVRRLRLGAPLQREVTEANSKLKAEQAGRRSSRSSASRFAPRPPARRLPPPRPPPRHYHHRPLPMPPRPPRRPPRHPRFRPRHHPPRPPRGAPAVRVVARSSRS